VIKQNSVVSENVVCLAVINYRPVSIKFRYAVRRTGIKRRCFGLWRVCWKSGSG
jgi:hypothetical protein